MWRLPPQREIFFNGYMHMLRDTVHASLGRGPAEKKSYITDPVGNTDVVKYGYICFHFF